jgi:chaperonin cofactor prefoldin
MTSNTVLAATHNIAELLSRISALESALKQAQEDASRMRFTLGALLMSGKLDDVTAKEVREPGEQLKAKMDELESALAEREREIERLRERLQTAVGDWGVAVTDRMEALKLAEDALAVARERECKRYDCPYWGAEILRLRSDIAAAREAIKNLQATCDEYEIRLGRDMDGRPPIDEPEVPLLVAALAAAREENERLRDALESNGGAWKFCITGHCEKEICPQGPEFVCLCRDPADGSCDLAEYWRQHYDELSSLRAQLAAAEEKIPTLEKANMGEFMGHPFSYWLALDDLAARDMLHHGDVVGEAPRNDGLGSMLAAARADAVREFAEWLSTRGHSIAGRSDVYLESPIHTVARYLSSRGVPSARPDDAGRIKRAAQVIADRIGFSPDNVYDVARDALAAADVAERGGQ